MGLPAATPASQEPPARPRGEIPSLTSLRGFLAVWVVAFHFWNDALRLFPVLDLVSPIARLGHMAVPAFFLLSGFVLAYNYADRIRTLRPREVVRFLGLRLARIYPVHFATLMVMAAVVAATGRFGSAETSLGTRDFVLSLFLAHTWVPEFTLSWNHPSWSISCEWFAYLLFPLAAATVFRVLTTPLRAVVFGVCCLMLSVYVMLLWRPRPFYELAHAVPLFFAGTAIFFIARGRVKEQAGTGGKLLTGLLVIGLAAACFCPSIRGVVLFQVFGFFGLILALASGGKKAGVVWDSRPSVFLGEVSYSLYMSHTLVQFLLHDLLPTTEYETADRMTKAGVGLVYLGAITLGCLATYYAVERPSRSLCKRLLAGKKAPPT